MMGTNKGGGKLVGKSVGRLDSRSTASSGSDKKGTQHQHQRHCYSLCPVQCPPRKSQRPAAL
jgi:hypothetical protein